MRIVNEPWMKSPEGNTLFVLIQGALINEFIQKTGIEEEKLHQRHGNISEITRFRENAWVTAIDPYFPKNNEAHSSWGVRLTSLGNRIKNMNLKLRETRIIHGKITTEGKLNARAYIDSAIRKFDATKLGEIVFYAPNWYEV